MVLIGVVSWPSILLLLAFAVLGILLVVLLIVLDLTVSVGTVNGLVLYANIVKIEEDYLFPPQSCSSTDSVHFVDRS